MSESFELRISDGRVLAYGVELDDCVDMPKRVYRVNGRLPREDFGRLCFTAGLAVGKAISTPKLPIIGKVD